VAALIGLGSGCGGSEATSGKGATSKSAPVAADIQAAMGALLAERGAASVSKPWVAYGTRAPLPKTTAVAPAAGKSDYNPVNPYWFLFVDEAPDLDYEHDVTFRFADAVTGTLTDEPQRWWAEIGGVGFVLAERSLLRVFSPVPPDPKVAVPTQAVGATPGPAIAWAIQADFDAGKADAKFAYEASGQAGYLNVVADLDSSGTFAGSGNAAEWLVQDQALPATAGWTFTKPFAMPLDASRKFAPKAWVRAVVTSAPIGGQAWDGTVGAGAAATDQFFSFDAWDGPDQEADAAADVVGPVPPVDPSIGGSLKGAPCSYFCHPDDVQIATSCRALVINPGDKPGKSWMHRNLEKAWGHFEILLGEGATAFQDKPTAAEAAAAIETFIKGVSCLDTAYIYITGHGARDGWIRAQNGRGQLTVAQVRAAIESAPHCPSKMDYYSPAKCTQTGYCNLNVIVQSCHSGNFLKSPGGIGLPGINVLTSASAGKESFGCGDGSCISNAFWDGFKDGQADKAPTGNGDGITEPSEAMAWAKQHYEGKDLATDSSPQSAFGADCECACKKTGTTTGTGCDPGNAGLSNAAAIGDLVGLGPVGGSQCAALTILDILHSATKMGKKAVAHDHTTIRLALWLLGALNQAAVDKLFNNSDFPCGAGPNGYTICPAEGGQVPAGDAIVLFNVLEKDVPLADPVNTYQYGFVFDSDGIGTNNYKPNAQYANDFFQDTDHWFEANYSPKAGWTLKVTDATGGAFKPVASHARVILSGNTIALVVGASELEVPKPRYRLTAFRHKGDYGMNPPFDWDGSIHPAVSAGLAELP